MDGCIDEERADSGEDDARRPPRSLLGLLIDPHFGGVFWGKFTSFIGVMIHSIVIAVMTFDATGSAFAVALSTGALFAPQLVLAPLCGAFADRGYDIAQIIWGRVVSAVGAAALATFAWLEVTGGWMAVAVIAVTSAVTGAGLAIGGAAMHSVVPRLVSREELHAAMALNTVPLTVSRVVGPIAGAALLVGPGAAAALVLCALGHLVFAMTVAVARLPAAPRRTSTAEGSVAAAWRFVRQDESLFTLLVAVAALNAAADPIQTLAPSIAANLGGSADNTAALVGIMTAAFGVGAGLGIYLPVALVDRLAQEKQVLLGFAVMTAGALAAASATSFPAVCMAFAAIGAGFTVSKASTSTLIQLRSPDELRGRVMALWMVAFVGARPMTALLLGLVADYAGVRIAFLITAAALVLIAIRCRPARIAWRGPWATALDASTKHNISCVSKGRFVPMKPVRSLLFVPGHRGAWADKAIAKGADGVILDLEDSVANDMKAEARAEVARSITRLRETNPDASVYVRLNPLDTGLTGDDIAEVAIPGLDGFSLPKLSGRDDIIRYEALVEHFEAKNGVPASTIKFIANLETAESYAECEQIAKASPRIATLFAGTARDADVSRAIGFTFTPGGDETLYLRSRAVLACRAAGLDFPLVGIWQDLEDDEGARNFTLRNRELGFRGQVLIHPSHIDVANEAFSPSAFEIEFYEGMIRAFEEAETQGVAAVRYEGMHVDYAHIKTAREVLAYAQNFAQN